MSMSVTATVSYVEMIRNMALLTLLANERKRPSEYIHEVGQPIWVWRTVCEQLVFDLLQGMHLLTELSNVHNVVLILQDCCLVIVHIQVVRCAEYGHDTGETSRPRLPVHAVPGILGFVCSDDRE